MLFKKFDGEGAVAVAGLQIDEQGKRVRLRKKGEDRAVLVAVNQRLWPAAFRRGREKSIVEAGRKLHQQNAAEQQILRMLAAEFRVTVVRNGCEFAHNNLRLREAYINADEKTGG